MSDPDPTLRPPPQEGLDSPEDEPEGPEAAPPSPPDREPPNLAGLEPQGQGPNGEPLYRLVQGDKVKLVTAAQLLQGAQRDFAAGNIASQATERAKAMEAELAKRAEALKANEKLMALGQLAQAAYDHENFDPETWARFQRAVQVPDEFIQRALAERAQQTDAPPGHPGGPPPDAAQPTGRLTMDQLPPEMQELYRDSKADKRERDMKLADEQIGERLAAHDSLGTLIKGDDAMKTRIVALSKWAIARRALAAGQKQLTPDTIDAGLDELAEFVNGLGPKLQKPSSDTPDVLPMGFGQSPQATPPLYQDDASDAFDPVAAESDTDVIRHMREQMQADARRAAAE